MKNIVVCVDLNENSLETLKKVKLDLDFEGARVHYLHVFEVHMYNADIVPIIYPTEIQYPDIEKSALEILSKLALEITDTSKAEVTTKCFFSHSREEKIMHYLQEIHADLVVVATRGKHGIEGFFSSSLADFLIKYSPCDVLVLRPKEGKKQA